ncbi:hypothetical protein B0H13DRAFT_2120793 [Mycena leptocephala]|nr:hypothetical protein B0H13DRAFT_2120793 [Mycena leptocephala]
MCLKLNLYSGPTSFLRRLDRTRARSFADMRTQNAINVERRVHHSIAIPFTAVTVMEQTGKIAPIRRNPPSHDSPDHSHRPQRSKIMFIGGGTALAVFLILAGLVIFVLATHDFHIDSGGSCHLGIARIASVWLMASGDGGINRPTPYQEGKAPPLSHPPILRIAVITLALLLGLAYDCHGFDTAFMGSRALTRRLALKQKIPYDSDPFNDRDLAGGLPEGIRVLNNASDLNAVVFTNDNIAIIPESIQWIGNTVGVSRLPQYNGDSSVDFNCPPSSSINNTALNLGHDIGNSYPFGIIDSQGNPLGDTPWHVETNHFHYLAVVISFAYVSPDHVGTTTLVGDTGFFVHGHSGSFNVISCDVDVLDVQYAYVNGSYTTRYTTMSDLDTTRRVASLSNENIPTQLPRVVDGIGLVSGNYAAAFSQELSREMTALSSQMWSNVTADQVFNVVSHVGSRFPLAPLGLLAIFMALYGLMALFLTFLALRATSVQADTSIARMRLMDPLTMIHAAYGPMDASRTWKDDSKALFGVEGEQDRLNVGPMALPDGSVAFGVSKGFSW